MNLLLISIGLGVLAIVYGFITSRQVLGADAGNEKMQAIAAAIQEGASAYLNRQYTVYGRVISGMQHVDKITRGEPPANPDRMITVRVAADVA